MYSFLEIEMIWKQCNTGQEWDHCLELFNWLVNDVDFKQTLTKDKVQHFHETALKQLNKIIENGNA
jgi:hypothetical protein